MNKLALNTTGVPIGETFFNNHPNSLTKLTGIGELVSLFVRIIFIVAGIGILILFILGGIGMLAGAGNSDPQKVEQGKKTATSALIGFVVAFVAYWIVQLIELWTGIKIL